MNALGQLKQKIADNSALVGIVGLGYVGLPLSIRFAEAGFRVLGFDNDPDKPPQLNRGESYIRHIPPERIAVLLENGFEATGDYARARQCDVPIPYVQPRLESSHSKKSSTAVLWLSRQGKSG